MLTNHRESPSFKLIEILLKQGAQISYVDPHVPGIPSPMRSFDLPSMESQKLTPEYLQSLDCALIATDHTAFDYDMIVKNCTIVVDTRNATKHVKSGRDRIWKA